MTKRKASLINRRGYFRDMKPVDYVLSVVGLLIGTAAALFPWHVYFNPESYGPPEMAFSRGGVVPPDEDAVPSSGTPLFEFETGRFVRADTPPASVDRLTTGKVDPNAGASGDPDQPFPGNGRAFTLFAVHDGRALVGDMDGVYLVSRKSRLPDGTTLEAIERDGKGWHIVTSDKRLIRVR
ncbi:hypothetical protein [Oricola cellulosilytica]|uniref:Flagellar protein n=1 Tax=Oricola cellulosilytica TaxID=1429082 RepID=A0A4R0PHD6_9HYPH|nr:hypothetical protein [Oricola cellulosilytica]TCD16194.1 hypothetical protein E0D97_01810 [Oricola cellulosilytica]